MDTKTQNPSPSDTQRDGSPTDAFRAAIHQLGEWGEYARYYFSARADGVKASVRQAGLYAILGMFGLMVLASLTVMSVVLLCNGLAGAVGTALQNPWLGDLIIGFALLLILALGAISMVSLLKRSSHRRTVKKYEQRKHQQRIRFGHDVQERAAETSKK